MKKATLCLALLALCLSMSLPVFAEEPAAGSTASAAAAPSGCAERQFLASLAAGADLAALSPAAGARAVDCGPDWCTPEDHDNCAASCYPCPYTLNCNATYCFDWCRCHFQNCPQ